MRTLAQRIKSFAQGHKSRFQPQPRLHPPGSAAPEHKVRSGPGPARETPTHPQRLRWSWLPRSPSMGRLGPPGSHWAGCVSLPLSRSCFLQPGLKHRAWHTAHQLDRRSVSTTLKPSATPCCGAELPLSSGASQTSQPHSTQVGGEWGQASWFPSTWARQGTEAILSHCLVSNIHRETKVPPSGDSPTSPPLFALDHTLLSFQPSPTSVGFHAGRAGRTRARRERGSVVSTADTARRPDVNAVRVAFP